METFYETLAHTADVAVRVKGASWEDLLRNAARALYDVLTDWESVEAADVERVVAATGGDREELLVAWLREILYLFDAERVLLAEFAFETAGERRVLARARGESFDPARHRIKTEIKAVTYHRVHVGRARGGEWTAEVVFDL